MWGRDVGQGLKAGTRRWGSRQPAVPGVRRAAVVCRASALKSYPVKLRSASEMTTFLFIV